MRITIEDMAKLRRIDTFGGRLRVAREDAGLKQEELTALLEERYGVHVGRSYISELERNWEANKMPMADVLAALAKALNVNGNWLLLLDDRPDLPDEDSGHGITPEAQEIAGLVDLLPDWRRAEMLDWLRHIADPDSELHQQARRTTEEIRQRLAIAESVLGPEAMHMLETILLRFAIGRIGEPSVNVPVSDEQVRRRMARSPAVQNGGS